MLISRKTAFFTSKLHPVLNLIVFKILSSHSILVLWVKLIFFFNFKACAYIVINEALLLKFMLSDKRMLKFATNLRCNIYLQSLTNLNFLKFLIFVTKKKTTFFCFCFSSEKSSFKIWIQNFIITIIYACNEVEATKMWSYREYYQSHGLIKN